MRGSDGPDWGQTRFTSCISSLTPIDLAGHEHCFIRQWDLAAKLSLPGHRRLQNARRHCGVCWTGETWKISLPGGVAGNSARRPTRFLLRQKVGQKRRPLRRQSALRADCTRRQELKREASETRFAQTADASLSVSVPADASPSNGGLRQKPLQKPLQKQEQRQRQLSLRGQWHRNAGLQVTTAYSTMPASQAGPAWQCGHSTYGSTGLATAACIRRCASAGSRKRFFTRSFAAAVTRST